MLSTHKYINFFSPSNLLENRSQKQDLKYQILMSKFFQVHLYSPRWWQRGLLRRSYEPAPHPERGFKSRPAQRAPRFSKMYGGEKNRLPDEYG